MRIATSVIRPGMKNTDVTAAVERVAAAYGVNPLVSVRMHQMKRFCLDHGKKEIALKTPHADDNSDKVRKGGKSVVNLIVLTL
jgi:methionine aminopeptidase